MINDKRTVTTKLIPGVQHGEIELLDLTLMCKLRLKIVTSEDL